jgi:hypothetical protein
VVLPGAANGSACSRARDQGTMKTNTRWCPITRLCRAPHRVTVRTSHPSQSRCRPSPPTRYGLRPRASEFPTTDPAVGELRPLGRRRADECGGAKGLLKDAHNTLSPKSLDSAAGGDWSDVKGGSSVKDDKQYEIAHHTKAAVTRAQRKADTDPEQPAFELDAVGSLANSLWQLEHDEKAFGRAQAAIRTRLHAAATASGRRALTAADLT